MTIQIASTGTTDDSGETVQPYDLLSTDPVSGTVSEIGSGFWNNSESYHDANDQDGYLYYIFVTGKNSYGYKPESMSVTYAIPDGYTTLSFSVGVHPKGSTNVGTAWIELRDENGNLISVTNQDGETTSTTKHMVYDDTAESYTADITGISRLTITAVPSDDMEEGTNRQPGDVEYGIYLLLKAFMIQ